MLALETGDDMSQPMAVLLNSMGTIPKRLAKNETPTYVWKQVAPAQINLNTQFRGPQDPPSPGF